MKNFGLVLVLLFSFLPAPAFAGGIQTIETELEKLETETVDEAAADLDTETSFSELLQDILTGEFDFTFAGLK